MLDEAEQEPRRHTTSIPAVVGRDRELRVLRERLSMAFAGHGSLVLLSGEAGIGKTTLVSLLAREATAQGALVLTGGCYDLTATPPYGPWREALDPGETTWDTSSLEDTVPLQAGVTTVGAGDVGIQSEIFEDTLRFLKAASERQPVLLVLEDLHWADPASLELLRYLARYLEPLPLLLVATYRSDDLPVRHLLFQLLPMLVRESRADRIDLRPLEDDDVQTLLNRQYQLRSTTGTRLVSYLQHQTGGNPFFLGEVLRTLEAEQLLYRGSGEWQLGDLDQTPVPPLIRQVVEGRLGGLDQQTRHLLEVAAVIGQVVPFDLWQAVSNAGDDVILSAIEQAIELHVLEPQPDGPGVHFHHALIRDALYDRILPPRLMAWHCSVAETLVQSAHPDPDAVAHHFQRSGDPRALEWVLRAGLRAWNAAAWLTAAERFRTAASILAGNEDRMVDRGWLLFATGYLLRFSRDSRTIDHLDEAERLANSTNDKALAAFVRYHRGTSRCIRGDALQGLPELELGVAALEELSRHVAIPDTDVKIRSMIQQMCSPDQALSEPPQDQNSTAVVTQRGPLVNWLSMAGRYTEALETGETFREQTTAAFGDEVVNIRTCLSGRMGLANAYTALGRFREASDEYAITSSGLARLGDHLTAHLTLWFELVSTLYLYRADNLDERARIVNAANRVWDHAGEQVWTSSSSSHCQLLADLVEGRWQNLSRISVDEGTIGGVHENGIRYMMGTVARHRGDTALAWEQVRAAFTDGPRSDPAGHAWFPVVFLMQSLAADLALDARDLKLAAQWIAAFDRWVEWSGAHVWTTHSLSRWAQYHHQSGDISLARQHAEKALSLAQEASQSLGRLHAHQLLGRLDLDTGQADDAERHINEAVALADACATPFERARALMLRAEVRASTGDPDGGLAALDEARAIYSLLDAWPALERIEQIAARFETAPHATRGQLSLSPRELEVLSLIAEGKTDREIAADLFISHHTVMSHVSHILNKLGVDSRAAAAAQAIRRNII